MITYTPGPDFYDTDSFWFKVTDDTGAGSEAEIEFKPGEQQQPPPTVEMRITDHDDPKKKWADNVVTTAPAYSGKSTGDMVSWKIVGRDASESATYSWSAEGPETKTGPSGAGKNEWKLADGDEDTAKDCQSR